MARLDGGFFLFEVEKSEKSHVQNMFGEMR